MSEQLLTLLKFSLLGLVYLFLLRVVRAVWAELAPPSAGAGAPKPRRGLRRRRSAPPSSEPTSAPAASPPRPSRSERKAGTHLRVIAPPTAGGASYPLRSEELTIGRSDGCAIALDDSYVSQVHARVFRRDGSWLVEDLGSTNGTWLNDERVGGPRPLGPGDRLQIGSVVMELQ